MQGDTSRTWRDRPRAWRWPGIAFFRLRLFFRGVFLLLALATVAIALSVLQDEKELSHRNYRQGFAKTMGQVAAQLRHPAGQLALLNPPAPAASAAASAAGAVHPLVLPFAALDFDDHNKVEQAVEMAGCTRQYPGDAALCVAIGSNPYAGGFVYVVGHAPSPPPVAHATGEHDLALSSRLRVDVTLRGRHYALDRAVRARAGHGRQRDPRPPDRLRARTPTAACCRAPCATSAAGCGKAARAWTAAPTSPPARAARSSRCACRWRCCTTTSSRRRIPSGRRPT